MERQDAAVPVNWLQIRVERHCFSSEEITLDKGHEVHEGVPAVFPPIPSGEPVNRLAFAKWLVSNDNPLTSRVVVNRYWENLFGPWDRFHKRVGSQGDLPTHPELLDWLSRELIESHWDTKALLKLIVTSATYRQSAKVSVEAAAADPENRWLAARSASSIECRNGS